MTAADVLKLGNKALQDLALKPGPDAVLAKAELTRRQGKTSVAQVPMMITGKMTAELKSLGHSEQAIRRMTPAAAWKILQTPVTVTTPFVSPLKAKTLRYMILTPEADFGDNKDMDISQTNNYVNETEKEVQFINGVGVVNGMIVIDTKAAVLNWKQKK